MSQASGLAGAARDLHWLAQNIPCQAACPARTDVPGYLEAISRGAWEEAYRINLADNVFPAVLGRVCSRPCEAPCRHAWPGLGEAVAICFSKRSAAEFRKAAGPVVLEPWFSSTGRRIAIVGAGAAGLAAARDLALFGHRVVVYERHARPGGMMRLGIPAFRLPRAIVEQEIRQIEAIGVEIRCGVEVGRETTATELARSHDALVLATGAMRPVALEIDGVGRAGVEMGLPFLISVNEHGRRAIGRRVVVIGGGFTAMDCARVAVRLGAESVTVAYRRGAEDIVVTPGEREETQREGVKFLFHAAPVAVVGGERATGVRLVRTRPGPPGKDGRARPELVPGSEFDVEADTVLLAIGQVPESWWVEGGLPENAVVAGDAATGSTTLIDAIAHGREVAAEVDARLMGRHRVRTVARIAEGRRQARTRAMDAIPRQHPPPPSDNRSLEAEAEPGLDETTALLESRRCYLCHYKYEIDMSRCIYCDQCVEVKPRPSCIVKVRRVRTDPDGRVVGWDPREWRLAPPTPEHEYFINQADCIRCNACLEVCPVRCISVQKVSWVRVPAEKDAPTD